MMAKLKASAVIGMLSGKSYKECCDLLDRVEKLVDSDIDMKDYLKDMIPDAWLLKMDIRFLQRFQVES